jgi:putative sterol carrier protein
LSDVNGISLALSRRIDKRFRQNGEKALYFSQIDDLITAKDGKYSMFSNISEMFEKLRERFDAEKARADSGLIAFELSGEGGGSFWLKVHQGALDIGEGAPPAEADAILRAEAGDLMKIMGGELNPMMAFMAGKVKVERNMGMVMKLMSWFGV